MFKKIASIMLAAMLIGSTAVVANAAVADDAVAAEDAVSVGADDSSAVGADDSSAVGADEGSESTGAGNMVYFEVPSDWKNEKITFYMNDNGNELIKWGSKKGYMKNDSGNLWSFDLSERGIAPSNHTFVIFTMDWGVQTCNLIMTEANYGDTAYCTGNMVENDVDSNKKSYEVKWKSGKNGNPKTITSIGNIIGDTYWPGEDAKTLMTTFLTAEDTKKNINNALKYNGKDTQQTIDDTAKALGLTWEETKQIVADCTGKNSDIDLTKWDPEKSSLKTSSGSGSGSGSGSSDSGSGSTTGGSSSSSGSSSTSSTVSSGENDTIYFILGGVMLAAIGVFFLARRRRDY